MAIRTVLRPSSLLIALLMLIPPASAAWESLLYRFCPASGGNYTANSTYQNNLSRLLSSLAANGSASPAGYYSGNSGEAPDAAYGVALCRGDAGADRCRVCLAAAAQDVVAACPDRKDAVVWYDYCLLRYTDQLLASPAISGNSSVVYVASGQVVAATASFSLFVDQLGRMVIRLTDYAAKHSSGSMFATGEAAVEKTGADERIYGLAQCIPDQPGKACEGCLREIVNQITQIASQLGVQGASLLGTTCFFRYELYSFYNGAPVVRIAATNDPGRSPVWLPSPVRPPRSSLVDDPTIPKENKLRSLKRISVIISLVVIGLIVVTLIGIWRKSSTKALRRVRALPLEIWLWVISIIPLKAPRVADFDMGEIPQMKSLLFDLSTLRAATCDFSDSNKLGEGGFGVVYKGILTCGQTVAVKRLSAGSKQGLVQLRNEVELLARQEHSNLVRLLGVCLEEEKLLVYEYMPNTSLDNFLFDPTRSNRLTWQLRYKIIKGVARGLLYLHQGSWRKIIHRDLKASNILLDENMEPKISDFGISRMFYGNGTHTSTSQVAGTFGYMAPEYVIRGQYSVKSDVFSFGVLVLEIVTGRSIKSFSYSEGSINLLSHVWQHWTVGTVEEIIDPSLADQCLQNVAVRCIQIGLLCVHQAPASRPTMASVVGMLDGRSTTVGVPSQPAFLPGQPETDLLTRNMQSLNELDITELDPR